MERRVFGRGRGRGIRGEMMVCSRADAMASVVRIELSIIEWNCGC